MKLEPRRVEAFLRDPGQTRVVLLFGDDIGLIRDRATRLTKAVAGAADDAFRVVELERDAAMRLVDEMASLPLTGGRRVVRVRDAGDGLVTAVQRVLGSRGPGLLVLEGGAGLTGRSRLRTLLERETDAAVIGCYPPEAAALAEDIRQALQRRRVSIDPAAVRWLETRLGGDRAVTQAELEKVALYVGPEGHADLAAAQACVGDLAGLSLDDAVFAATAGDVSTTDRSVELALSEGAAPVAVVRAALAHVQRLHQTRLAMETGMPPADAMRALRPPVFIRREAAFQRALGLWSGAALTAAADRLWDADRGCKRTGAPAETICRNAVLGLARRAAAAVLRL